MLRLCFLESPREVLSNGKGMAGGIALERNALEPGPGGSVRARGTGKMSHVEVGPVMVF